ncbi:MAG: cation transporter [Lentimicrobiaceae bacterium]|nr:cation transporter [Lentimicrobiaceae bacterium]MCB9024018.1 cation transporter [Lentimicrobiaceae bacterium]MCO5265776.1 cation diffusion facilitator family transporter [Lentimicrobium sp.]HPG32383.1 cation diffusion facilitator family transporter [Lentimicrobium sp.]
MNSKNNQDAITEGWVSVGGNIMLFILKFWAGIATGSIAIIADAWHTLSDSLTSIVVVIAAKVSAKPADKEHPFGHGRAELIAAMIIGMLLSVVAFNFILEGVKRLQTKELVSYSIFAIVATVISVIAKEGMAQYAFHIARKTGSKSVRADGWHHRSDAISSLVILAGIFLGKQIWWVDGVLGIIVALLIFYAAYDILKDAINIMMGETPENSLIRQIESICKNESLLELAPHHFHIHRYGDHTEMTFHIRLPDGLSIFDAHEIATRIEKHIKEDTGIISTIHMEPEGIKHY